MHQYAELTVRVAESSVLEARVATPSIGAWRSPFVSSAERLLVVCGPTSFHYISWSASRTRTCYKLTVIGGLCWDKSPPGEASRKSLSPGGQG